MRLGWIANVLGTSGIALVLVSTPALADTISSGSCEATAASPVAAVATTLRQANDGGFWHHALSFGEGAALGLATGVAVTAGIAALAATAPVWVTAAATTALVGAGVYGVWRLHARWAGMSTDAKLFTAGNVVGGIAAGGLSGAVTRGIGGIFSGSETSASAVATALSARPGVSLSDAAAMARASGQTVTHIASGATASEVAGATDQGVPVLVRVMLDGNGNPTVAGAPGAHEQIVVVDDMTEDGEVFAKRAGGAGDVVWSIPAFDASMRSAGGEIVIVHGPTAH